MLDAKNARIADLIVMKMMENLVVKKVIKAVVDQNNPIECMGQIQISLLSSQYFLSQNANQEAYIGCMTQIQQFLCSLQNIILLSLLGQDEYYTLQNDFRSSLDEFLKIHDQIFAKNAENLRKAKGKLN